MFVYVSFSFIAEEDGPLRGMVWDPVKGEKHPYMCLDEHPDARDYDEDQLKRSEFWRELIRKTTKRTELSDKPVVLAEKTKVVGSL